MRILFTSTFATSHSSPKQLHFAKPSVYHEIYNAKNRWTKDVSLYHMTADEKSTFSLCEYDESKKRRDITLPLFSRKSVIGTQHLIQEGVRNCLLSFVPLADFCGAFRCSSISCALT